MTTEVYDVTCSECEQVTTVVETHIPATRWDPPDGDRSPEECPKCGHEFDSGDDWTEAEPDPDRLRDEWEDRKIAWSDARRA